MKKKILLVMVFVMFLFGCGRETANKNIEELIIDIDVSVMSDVMAYSTLENIMYNPTEYIGKMAKIKGSFYYEYYEELNMKFYAILLMDETDCCMAFAEVEFEEGIEYPRVGDECVIIGEVKTKMVDGYEYAYIDVVEREY